LQRIMVIHLI